MFLPDGGIAAYPFRLQEGEGGLSWPNFPVVNETQAQQMPNRTLRLGQIITDRDGCAYQMVKAGAGLTIGQVVKPKANLTGTTITADTVGDNIHVIKTNLAGLTLNGEVGNFLVVVTAAATLLVRRIKANTATSGGFAYLTISKKDTRFARGGYDPDTTVSSAVLANGLVAHIVRPWVVDVAGAGEVPVGVALGTVTSGNLTAVQIHGLCTVASVGNTDSIVDNGIMVTAAAGAVKGPLGAGISGAEAYAKVGIAKIVNANVAGAFSVGFISLFGRW